MRPSAVYLRMDVNNSACMFAFMPILCSRLCTSFVLHTVLTVHPGIPCVFCVFTVCASTSAQEVNSMSIPRPSSACYILPGILIAGKRCK